VSLQNKVRRTDTAGWVKRILASKNLTLHQVSHATETLYGKCSPFFLPHNFYSELALESFTPSLHQVFALSRVSGYRLADWIQVFGFDTSDVTHLQVLLPVPRTILLDSTLEDPQSWIVWLRSKRTHPTPSGVVPLGRLLEYAPCRRLASLLRPDSSNFVYAKLGRQDAFSFPDLLPGSIVRVNRTLRPGLPFPADARLSNHYFLIEHTKGFCCCRIQPAGKDRIIPISTQLPYAQVELRVPDEAEILGVVDVEVRPLLKTVRPEVAPDLSRHWRPRALTRADIDLGRLLRHTRMRLALSFREASDLAHQIAEWLGDRQYFASPGSLSDYEALETAPRHIHKAIALCAIYGLKWLTFLRSAGLNIEDTGNEPIPDEILDRSLPTSGVLHSDVLEDQGELLNDWLRQWNSEIPYFLRESLSALSGLRRPSLHDVFWIDQNESPLDLAHTGGLLALVNRRKKKPVHEKSTSLWQQPLYMVLHRDGTYRCAFASLENGTLVLHSYAQGYHRSERLRNRHDAEIAGQVVCFARKLL